MPHEVTPLHLWSLTGEAHRPGELSRITITQWPYSVGRSTNGSLVLPYPGVSSVHARLEQRSEQLWVEDLRSTNGTWVNGLRIDQPTQLLDGDVVQFGDVAFRVESWDGESSGIHSDTQSLLDDKATSLQRAQRIDTLVKARRIRTLLQPIVRVEDGRTVAYECLARGDLEGLSTKPEDLFALAALRHREAELSAVCREMAFEELSPWLQQLAARNGVIPSIHSNVHPREADDAGFLDSLREIRERFPKVPLILEIHERSILSPESTRELLGHLRGLGCRVAFDDFGAGLARLSELAECPPDVLKFDRSLVTMLMPKNRRIRQLMESLVTMAKELGCMPTATGIETQDQFAMCRDIGFELAQGFALGRPQEIERISGIAGEV